MLIIPLSLVHNFLVGVWTLSVHIRTWKAALGDTWQVVPSGGNPAFRFFTVEVALP